MPQIRNQIWYVCVNAQISANVKDRDIKFSMQVFYILDTNKAYFKFCVPRPPSN